MSLTPFVPNPWAPFRSLDNDMRLLRNLVDLSDPTSQSVRTIEPSYSFEADDNSAHFEIEMPGVAKEDLTVDINAHKLVIKGRRFKKGIGAPTQPATDESNGGAKPQEPEKSPSLIYLLEARLGHGADLDNVKADLCGDGILVVHVPMKQDKGARRIQIGL